MRDPVRDSPTHAVVSPALYLMVYAHLLTSEGEA
jgi:hypothetical protein